MSEAKNGDDRRAAQFHKVAVSEAVGREEYVNKLLLKLIPQDRHHEDDDSVRVISVVGSEATCKTAVARSVYDTLEVKRWFACRAWVNVQDNYSVGDALVNILRQISTHELKNVDLTDEDGQSLRLHEYFYDHRYLIVLDNMNKVDMTVKILTYLIESSNGSRVIITTRKKELPYHVDPWVDPLTFHPLTEEDRMKLLLLCSSENEPDIGQVCPARSDLLQRILCCCGLSAAGIRLLGGLLSVTQESGKFKAMIGSLQENASLTDIVSFCYDQLSPSLQLCIMYVCQFPREYEIPTRRLLRLWLAESLTPAPESGLQDAESCFQELVCRNMIHVVSRCKGTGPAKTCRMPGFIYDFLLQKVLEVGSTETNSYDSSTNTPNGEPKIVARWIVADKPSINDRLDGSSSEAQEQSDQRQFNLKQLRSYISFDTKKNRTQKRGLDIFLNPGEDKKSSLEVLDLEGVYKPVLPKNLGKVLFNLKYLGLRWTILDELPKSVGDLPCLETLDVKHTNITKLPSSIWTKKSLRHLYLNEVSFDKSIPHPWWLSPSSKLSNKFETLCGLHIEDNSPMLDVLSKLTGITKLSLTCPSTVIKEVIERVKGLTTLQSLKLSSKDLLGQPSKFHLEDMNRLMSLSNLYLFGDLRNNNLSFLPKNLKSLTLSMTFLAIDAIDVLAKLECLTDFRLHAFSYEGTTLTCAKGTFPQLRVLKVWKLANLESLVVEKEAMPNLEELDIRDCQKLGEIQVLGDRMKLKEVDLAMVKEELAQSLEASLGRSIIITTELIASATATEAS